MNIQNTRSFTRDYRELREVIKGRVDKRIALLLTNPRHPSLHLKKVRGTEGVWEIRVTLDYRITLQIVGDTLLLRRVRTHDVLREP
jgi:mRNA-degrading endonuclease RelE of RelBE toxin-antitoxin system